MKDGEPGKEGRGWGIGRGGGRWEVVGSAAMQNGYQGSGEGLCRVQAGLPMRNLAGQLGSSGNGMQAVGPAARETARQAAQAGLGLV